MILKEGENSHNYFEGLSGVYTFVQPVSLTLTICQIMSEVLGNKVRVPTHLCSQELDMEWGRLNTKMTPTFLPLSLFPL